MPASLSSSAKDFSIILAMMDAFFEKEPLENLSKNKQLVAYKHFGFWHPMDTLRDRIALNLCGNQERLLGKFGNNLSYNTREILIDKDFWRGKKVFITGHTGFKGSWLCLWVKPLGSGYSPDLL